MKFLPFFFVINLALMLSGCQNTGNIDNYSQIQTPEGEQQSNKNHVSGFLSDYSARTKREFTLFNSASIYSDVPSHRIPINGDVCLLRVR